MIMKIKRMNLMVEIPLSRHDNDVQAAGGSLSTGTVSKGYTLYNEVFLPDYQYGVINYSAIVLGDLDIADLHDDTQYIDARSFPVVTPEMLPFTEFDVADVYTNSNIPPLDMVYSDFCGFGDTDYFFQDIPEWMMEDWGPRCGVTTVNIDPLFDFVRICILPPYRKVNIKLLGEPLATVALSMSYPPEMRKLDLLVYNRGGKCECIEKHIGFGTCANDALIKSDVPVISYIPARSGSD